MTNYFTFRTIEIAGIWLNQVTAKPRGLRLCIYPTTKYYSFIRLLNITQRQELKRYWLDFRHEPYTLNFIGETYQPNRFGSDLILTPIVFTERSVSRTFNEELMQWLTNAKTYLSIPDWRNTLLLLLLLGLLSGWRLRRQWRRALS